MTPCQTTHTISSHGHTHSLTISCLCLQLRGAHLIHVYVYNINPLLALHVTAPICGHFAAGILHPS